MKQVPMITGYSLMLFRGILLLLALVSAFSPLQAVAANSGVIISPNGYEGFALNAFNVTGVKAWNIYIEYDAAALTDPSVNATPLLSRVSFTAGLSSPGVITVYASSAEPLDYMGNLLHLGFDQSGEKPGKIYSAKIYVTRSNGVYEPVPVTIVNPPDPPASPDEQNQLQESEAGARNESVVAETAKTPDVSPEQSSSSSGKGEAGRRGGETVVVAPPYRSGGTDIVTKSFDGTLAAATAAAAKPTSFTREKSVLDRFREFSTFTDEKLLIAAFRGDPTCAFRQEPGVALSNGEAGVTITMKLDITGKKGPIFLLRGVSFSSLKMPEENLWTLKVIPSPGVYEASITAYYDDRMTEFPLTVTPSLEWYLQKRTGKPEWGSLDYYVYIANILAKSAGER